MPIRLPAIVVLAALALSVVALAGCPQSRDAFVESAREPAVRALPAYTGQSAHATAYGTHGGGTLDLPDDFPDDIYLPADYRINSLMDRGALRVVSLQAPGQVSALFGDARASMDHRGWKQTMAMRDATDSALLSYEKDDRAAVLSFSDDRSGGVTINVQLREDVH